MHYGKIILADCANGIGIRVSLFVSGCTNCCPGCFQSETWDFDYGDIYTKETEDFIVNELKKSYYDGLTLLGGEPFEISNQIAILPLVKRIKTELQDKTIWAYTGFTYDVDLVDGGKRFDPTITNELLNNIDILVDGKFINSLKNISLRFKGSENQRVIDLKKSRAEHRIVLSPYND